MLATLEYVNNRMKSLRLGLVSSLLFTLAALANFTAQAQAQSLGTAENFVVLGGSTVASIGPTTVSNGDVGVSPGSSITGFPPGILSNGAFHANDGLAMQAQADLSTAYTAFSAPMPLTTSLSGELGGLTLTPGVYNSTGSDSITSGDLTLDAQGDSTARFIFQIPGAFFMGSSSAVRLINGADPRNVYFTVGSSANLGTNCRFSGNILAQQSITAGTGANVTGRLLAKNSSVTLDTNNIVSPGLSIHNTPPVANAQSVTTNEDTAKAITLTASDVDGNPLTYSVVTGPTNGSLSGTAPNLTYTPGANYNGSDSFTFKANDGAADSNTATVSITVSAVNDAPTLSAISNPAAILEDAAQQTVNLAGIGTGASNETQVLAVTATSGTTALIPNPTVTYTSPNATGSLAYTPVPNANGTAVITVTVTDNGGTANGGVNTFQRTFTVTVSAVNDAPTITGQLPVSTSFNTARTLMFSDLQVTDVDNSYPTGFTLTASNGVNYTRSTNTITPVNNFFGTLAVPVKVNDGALDSNSYQLAMTVNPTASMVQIGGQVANNAGGGYRISFIGNPGQQYTVQYSNVLPALPANWSFLSFQVADPNGRFSIIDTPPAGTAFRVYRAIVP